MLSWVNGCVDIWIQAYPIQGLRLFYTSPFHQYPLSRSVEYAAVDSQRCTTGQFFWLAVIALRGRKGERERQTERQSERDQENLATSHSSAWNKNIDLLSKWYWHLLHAGPSCGSVQTTHPQRRWDRVCRTRWRWSEWPDLCDGHPASGIPAWMWIAQQEVDYYYNCTYVRTHWGGGQ